MKLFYPCFLLGVAMGMVEGIQPKLADSATVLSADKAEEIVVIRNLTVKDGAVSGELLNKSSRLLRDVHLLMS